MDIFSRTKSFELKRWILDEFLFFCFKTDKQESCGLLCFYQLSGHNKYYTNRVHLILKYFYIFKALVHLTLVIQ